MADAVPGRIAAAIAAEINAGTWTLQFEARESRADFAEKLEDQTSLLCDVVPLMRPRLELDATRLLTWTVPVTIGLRKLLSDPVRRPSDGSIDPSEIAKYEAQLVDLFKYFAPSTTNPSGRALTSEPTAAWDDSSEIIALYRQDFLARHSQYWGMIRVVYSVPEST